MKYIYVKIYSIKLEKQYGRINMDAWMKGMLAEILV